MGKRTWSVALCLALIAGVFSALPARAQTPTPIPATVNIEDPSGDANGLNDQGFGGICLQDPACTPETGDNPGGVGIGAADILKVWFTNTSTAVSAHILTTFPPPNATPGFGLIYRVILNGNCTYLQGLIPSNTYAGAQKANVREFCDGTATTEGGEITIEALDDGTGITTLTYPLDLHPALKMGATLATPFATTTVASGTDSPALFAPTLDDTLVGIDYTIASGGPVAKPPAEEPPGKSDPPGKGKKKGCKKGKGKKKGACPGKKPPKPPAAPSCPAYVPGEEGAEAETSVVTNAATAEAPVVVEFESEPGLGNDLGLGVYDGTYHFFHNVQVDTSGTDTGIYARLDFFEGQDYDLYLNYPDGSEADHSGDFNPVGPPIFGCGGASCESSLTSEAILGIRTPDCGGWTVEMVSFLSEGGPVTLSLWLGEALADPAPPEGGETALDMFYRALGL